MNKKEKAIHRSKLSDIADIWDNAGKVAYHSDGFSHWMAKACIGFILRKNNHKFATEVEFDNGAIADVIDLNTFIVYELESNYTEKDKQEKYDNFWEYEEVRDIIVLDPQELSGDLKTMRTELENKLVL